MSPPDKFCRNFPISDQQGQVQRKIQRRYISDDQYEIFDPTDDGHN